MATIADYQTDNLILLVGTNPLPNYVAGKVLWNGKGKIYFLATRETHDVAERISAQLDLEIDRQFEILENVESSRANQIYDRVAGAITGMKGSIGLNYTGGTKAMGIHAYRAAKDSKKDIRFSYLDAQTLEMCFDDNESTRFAVGNSVQMKVEDLLVLHGFSLNKKYLTQPERLHIVHSILANQGEWRSLTRQLRCGKDLLCSENDFKEIELSLPDTFPEDIRKHANLSELAKAWGFNNTKSRKELAKWLEGGWLESYVLGQMQQIAKDCHLNQGAVVSNVEIVKPHFELDVVAVRGYQMLVISCTTDSGDSLNKSKLFEVDVRARQIGGDEARLALVCMSDNPVKIKHELETALNARNQVAVFGKADIADLAQKLKRWINEQPLS